MKTAVDTNALIALLYDDEHADDSEAALKAAYEKGAVVVTPIVYAELAADGTFEDASALDRFLKDMSIRLVEPSRQALATAGDRFREYVDRRPDGLQCPSCGTEQTVECKHCDTSLSPRQHIAADFLIGGHATTDVDALITLDEGFYGSYFPSLTVRPK